MEPAARRLSPLASRLSPLASRLSPLSALSTLPHGRLPSPSDAIERLALRSRLWAQAFGLVAAEACARGIPCVSSTNGGLAEANVLSTSAGFEALAVRTPIFYDQAATTVRRDTTMEEIDEAWRAGAGAGGASGASGAGGASCAS